MNPLHWTIQFAFGCHHRHVSRLFTIKKRTYKVCLDCGHEFELPAPYAAELPGISEAAGNRVKAISRTRAA